MQQIGEGERNTVAHRAGSAGNEAVADVGEGIKVTLVEGAGLILPKSCLQLL